MTEARPTFSVSELNSYVNLVLGLDGNLKDITVTGEISGFKRHPSGHLYFTLKDENASVRAVMFKFNAFRLSFLPKDGLSVTVKGHVGLYEKDGSFQLYADSMTCTGSGELFRKFLALKEELSAAGWFEQSLKKEIPFLPAKIGVVTSSSGAAIEDIRKVIGRRFPGMPILLYPASVQGAGAAEEIAAAIEKADREHKCDVLIVGRGGGSLEDLWAFNELPVAKAVHACGIPVISAVGHEIDFSICDFVADVRAATPSAAAELAVPEHAALKSGLESMGDRLNKCMARGLFEKRTALRSVGNATVMKNGRLLLEKPSQKLEMTWNGLCLQAQKQLSDRRVRLQIALEKLKAHSPKTILAKGFAAALDERGRQIRSAAEAVPGTGLVLRFSDGTVHVTVDDICLDSMR